jgi:hypothetical protein
MGIIKDVRSVTLPDGNLARRDTQSQLVTVNTGKFARNCVLTGKSATEMDYPIYIREPGLISPAYDVCPDGLGYLDASEGAADNVKPKHNSNATDSDYWTASTIGAWVAYHHELRPTMIRGYRFVTANGYTPRVWRIEGSNDNATWTTLHSVTVDWTWGDGKQTVEQDVPTENRDYFMHHRLIIDEFDATAVRIYNLQFWDSLCASPAEFYLDADSESPVQIAFADGFNTDGTPKNIPVTINTGIQIDATEVISKSDLLATSNVIPCALYAKYDADLSSVSFLAEVQVDLYIPFPPDYLNISYISGVINSGSWPEIFDSSLSTALRPSSEEFILAVNNPIYVNYLELKTRASPTGSIYFSENNGISWELAWTGNADFEGNPIGISLDRTYYVTQIKLTTAYVYWYYMKFFDASVSSKNKMSNGKVYEYDQINEVWNHIYKVPLGYFSLWKNPDGSAWEIANFIPTFVPQMAIAPWFRSTN